MTGQIALLPKEVVDRIAAGEVVQRPVSVVKELLENCLDAGASKVVITFTPPPTMKHESCGKIVVSDNGRGMSPEDLPLAATRHATSKLRSVRDFDHLQSFGFRGEALASISMVSRLSIISRKKDATSGYTMNYVDGKPTQPEPVPRARQVGTTITVSDLFYNLKQRRPSRDDFKLILDVVQKYALLCAGRGVGIACEKAGKHSSTDLNTAMGLVLTLQTTESSGHDAEKLIDLKLRATKEVITMLYGTALESHLKHFECQKMDEKGESNMYACSGWIVMPSYGLATTKKEKQQFILFINQRLVDSRPIQRALEEVYVQFASHKPPFLFLSIEVPPTTVDVNVHPNKRECALLNLDLITKSLTEHLHQILENAGQSFSVTDPSSADRKSSMAKNQYKRRKADPNENEPTHMTQTSLSQTAIAPSKKVRTSRATQSGALEPFLVRKEPLSQASTGSNTPSSQSTSVVSPSQFSQDSITTPSSVVHHATCPLMKDPANVDLAQPGAFATLSSQCTCNVPASSDAGAATVIRLPKQALSNLRRVPPKYCLYQSIQDLRNDVQMQTDENLQKRLRQAYFVGVVNAQRSLVQVGEELLLFNHGEAAKHLFYQLALNHFPGGAAIAEVGPIDIYSVIANMVQFEESLHSSHKPPSKLEINETNRVQAEQATTCLFLQAELLKEYFSVRIDKDEQGRIVLKGLPVLLEGYTPSPHALPLFLLRLATEVDWKQEKSCFHDVCSELGRFYASIPTDCHLASHVRHTLFPALTSLLVPVSDLAAAHGFTPITKLSKLYRIFERC